jgi:hypothetical protein
MDDILTDVHVDRTNGVIEQVYIALAVDCPSKRYSSFLPSGEVYPVLADHGAIAVDQDMYVLLEAALAEAQLVSLLLKFQPEENVVPHRGILDPRLLAEVCSRTIKLHADANILGIVNHLSQKRLDDG